MWSVPCPIVPLGRGRRDGIGAPASTVPQPQDYLRPAYPPRISPSRRRSRGGSRGRLEGGGRYRSCTPRTRPSPWTVPTAWYVGGAGEPAATGVVGLSLVVPFPRPSVRPSAQEAAPAQPDPPGGLRRATLVDRIRHPRLRLGGTYSPVPVVRRGAFERRSDADPTATLGPLEHVRRARASVAQRWSGAYTRYQVSGP